VNTAEQLHYQSLRAENGQQGLKTCYIQPLTTVILTFLWGCASSQTR